MLFNTEHNFLTKKPDVIKVVLLALFMAVPFFPSRVNGGDSGAVSPADAAFRLGEVYVYPNPVGAGKNPNIHVEAGLCDGMDIRIVDLAGALVHSVSIQDKPGLIGAVYAYEYTWDSGGVASGVYVCVITAHKEGESDLRIRKKFAVVR